MTRARTRQLKYQVLLFLENSTIDRENMMLPNQNMNFSLFTLTHSFACDRLEFFLCSIEQLFLQVICVLQ